MTTNTQRYDLVEVDVLARQMRADMLAAAFRRLLARLRRPRGAGPATAAQAA